MDKIECCPICGCRWGFATEVSAAKPKNPYHKGMLLWEVFEGEWDDLTVTQIAEVLDREPKGIHAAIQRIYQDTGYAVPHIKLRAAGSKSGR